MLRSAVILACCVVLAGMAGPARSKGFAPCADAAGFPALEGSLCVVAEAPLRPRSDDDAETLELFVRKFPAPEGRERVGEVWLVAGGPGESGASFYPLLATMRDAFPGHDLIVPDHRGTGYSDKLCPDQEAPDSAAGIALAGEEWGPCIGALHGDLARAHSFTITHAAYDLSGLIDRYRGEGPVYVYAVSYGTQLVLRMMQAAPVALDGLILDGLVPPENAPQWDIGRRTRIVDGVGRALLTTDQTEAYAELLAHAASGPDWLERMPGGDPRQFMGALLNFPELRVRIPALVDALARGETALLDRTVADLQAITADMAPFPQSPPSLPLVMLISGSENNARRGLTAETVAGEAEGALFTSPLPGLLVNTPVPLYELDEFFGGTPSALPRTLIVHGTLDPNTPHEGAVAHAAMLSEAGEVHFTTVEGGAHLLPFVAADCFVQAVSAFVAGARPPDRCTFVEASAPAQAADASPRLRRLSHQANAAAVKNISRL